MKISPYVFPGIKSQFLPQKKVNLFNQKHDIIVKIISEEMGVTMEGLFSKSREQELVEARHILCGILRENYKYTLKVIGRLLNRDHTTAINSIRKFKDRCEVEEGYLDKVNDIVKKINNEI